MLLIRKIFSITALLWITMLLFGATVASASNIQGEVLYYVNERRTNIGLPPVFLDVEASIGASVRAKEAQIDFAHLRPDGRQVKTVLQSNHSWFGENLAISEHSNAKKIVQSWMMSPLHRANILNKNFRRMGVECKKNKKDGLYYWALLFTGD